MSVVYFVKHKFMKPIKIGYSNNLKMRLQDLKCASPYGLEIIGTIPTYNAQYLEKIIHERLKNRRLNGEWFDISHEEAVDIIKESDNSYDDRVQRTLLRLDNTDNEKQIPRDRKLEIAVSNFLEQNHDDSDIDFGNLLDKQKVIKFIMELKLVSRPTAYRHWEFIKEYFIVKKRGRKAYVGLLK
tara:strand:- start:4332 stop:4883 length:552 start_codon:yes stop_codon:yes gene_type:complete